MKRTVLLLAVLATALFLNAQTPINDEYTGAIEVIPSTDALCRSTASGNTLGATQSMPGCFGSAEDDIWFKFTATSNRHRIVVTGDIINHVLELFNLSSGNLTSIACRYLTNPSSYGGLTAEFNTLIPGTTYYYRVYGSGSSSQQGQIRTCIISPPPPPANDECNGAIALPVNADENCTNIYSGKFGYASQSFPGYIDKGYDAFDIWFKFTATAASHRLRLTYDDNTTTPLMQAFSGNCNNLVSIGYFTPAVQYQNQPMVGMLTNLTPGNTYYIRIYNDGSVSSPNETIGLCISSPLGAPGYQYPIVSLTSPANGSVFTAPTSINLSAAVVEGEEPVKKVEFFYREGQHSDIKLGEDLTAPYEYVWNNTFPGSYRITAKATDLIGATANSAIDITVNTPPTNQLPTVNLYAYAIGSAIAPGTIALNVMAQDPDGTIAKIEIYQNGMFLFEAQPWNNNFGFADVAPGVYMYQAKAIDNQGGATFSNMVPVAIHDALQVNLTAPVNNATFTTPATISLAATPSGGDGTFSKVEFYNGTTKLGEDLTAPYTFNWTNVAAGTYSLTAKVFHNMGDSAVSQGIQVTVLCPSVKPVITANGSLNFCNGGSVTLTSSATTNNQWYKDNVAINGATNQSYVVSTAGNYKVVHSNACGSSTSDPVAVTAATTSAVTFTLVNSTNDLDIQALKDGDSINLATLSGTNLSIRANSSSPIGSMVFNLTGAQTVNQTESVAPYALFGDTDGDYYDWTPAVGNYTLKATPFCEAGGTGTAGTAATINFKVINKPPINQLPTVNLFAHLVGSGIAPGTISLNAMAQDPDGTIAKIEIYQNGDLVYEVPQSVANIGFTGLSSGGYMYQAKAIDNQGGSTLSQLIPLFIYEPLKIGLTAPASGSNFTAPATINLEATPAGGDGTFSKVEFYNGTTKLGEDVTAPYTFNWTNVTAGSYSLTAKVFHSMGDNATSNPVTITVSEPANQLPNISLTAPVNGASSPAPATVTLTAVASDADGSITKVEFYNGASKIGEDFTAPYQYEWIGVGAGFYSLTAKAIDNRGGISTSTAVSITILNPVNQPPSLSLNAPLITYGPTNADPVTIFSEAIAYDPDGSIAKVEFYQNGMPIGVATTPPYHFFAVIMKSGPYTFTARAYDNLGASSEMSVSVLVQRAPRVILNSPANGTTFTAPAIVNLSATVDQGDGVITKVEFYNGTTKLGEDLTAPYTFSWNNVGIGTYTVTAKVSDDWGQSTFSPEVTFTVNEPVNQPPTIILTAPAGGTTFTAPATVSLTATATDADGSIAKVEFYNGSTKIGEDITAPYQYEWSGISSGTYVLTTKAIDNQGAIATSPAVSITVSEPVNQLPTVNLTSPANGASFNAPASINLTATASDADGTINKVEFYNGTTKLGEDLVAPYEYSWSGATTGNYSLSAKAIDNMGGVSSSNTASVSVVTPPAGGTLVNKNSVWKYNDKGVDLGTSWTALNYNDASWSSGPGVLGYGMPVATTLNFGNKNNKYPSYYFRRSFEITDASIYTTLVFNIRRDDGAVVYLNGVEQFRTNMPGGIVGYNSFASSDLNGPDQSNYISFRIAASQLRAGTNVIAVSVHQSARRSADMSFDMEVIAETTSANQLVDARMSTGDNLSNKEISVNDKGKVLVKALPNPSTSYFTLLLQSSRSETIDIRVIDAIGRLVETRRKLPATAPVKLGYNYRPGIYFAEVIQGTQITTLKLIKSTY